MDSYAIIEDDAQKTQELYRVGDTLQNARSSRSNGIACCSKGRAATRRCSSSSRRQGRAGPAAAPSANGIQQRSDTDFVIDAPKSTSRWRT